jgi:hypothetical protein
MSSELFVFGQEGQLALEHYIRRQILQKRIQLLQHPSLLQQISLFQVAINHTIGH